MDIWLGIYASLMMILGVYAIVNITLNLLYFKKLDRVEDRNDGPLISVVIPARNEEGNIGKLLDSMIAQDYQNLEILVINDQSTDRTQDILDEYSRKDGRIRVFQTDPSKPFIKNGKINALMQLIPHARGEYMLCTDADTVHSPNCISHAYSIMRAHSLDIISGFPKELCQTFSGSLCVAAMMLTYAFVPQWFVYRFPIPAASFAIGQFIMMRKDAYDETGGYAGIADGTCDDIGIVRLFVKKHRKYAFIDLSRYSSCRMYRTGRESFRGIERSIVGVIPPKPIALLPTTAVVIIFSHISLSPIASVLFIIFTSLSPMTLCLLAGTVLFHAAWYISCRTAKWPGLISISCSLTLIAISAMYIHGLFRSLSGKGFEWKGRLIR